MIYMQGEMSNHELHKLCEWVWPWPCTFKAWHQILCYECLKKSTFSMWTL